MRPAALGIAELWGASAFCRQLYRCMMQWKQRGCRAGPRDTLRMKTIYLPWGWLVASRKGADNDEVAPCSPHPLFPQPRSLWRGYLSDPIFILIFFYTLLLLLVIDSWKDCSLTLRKHRGQQLRRAQRKTLLNPSPPSTKHGDFMASYSLGHLYLIVACFHSSTLNPTGWQTLIMVLGSDLRSQPHLLWANVFGISTLGVLTGF